MHIKNTKNIKYIGIRNLPNIIHSIIQKNTYDFNIIVAGGSGNGKTKFIQYLMKTKLKQMKPTLVYENDFKKSSSASKKLLIDGTNLDFEEYRFKVVDNPLNIHIRIIEISNIGDSMINKNTIEPILNFINQEYNNYHMLEQNTSIQNIRDNRIHLFLYFFDALSPRAIDIKILNTVNYHVNLIPCCSFSDILSNEEREVILQSSIYKKIEFFKKSPIQFISEPKRKYSYGQSKDGFEFSRAFLKNNLLALIDNTEIFYQAYKRKRTICDLLKRHKNEILNEDLVFLKKFLDAEEN